ncbi:hypothetical protein D3C86_2088960 [compost metagenome]
MTKTLGPIPNFSVPKNFSVAVGTKKAGPTPKIIPLVFGAKKAVTVASLKPNSCVFSPVTSCWSTTGRI